MAKKTKKEKKAPAKPKVRKQRALRGWATSVEADNTLIEDVPARFGRVSLGEDVISFPIAFEREDMPDADRFLQGGELECRLVMDPGRDDDVQGQQVARELTGTHEILVRARVGGYHTNRRRYRSSFQIAFDADVVAELSKFIGKAGSVSLRLLPESQPGLTAEISMEHDDENGSDSGEASGN